MKFEFKSFVIGLIIGAFIYFGFGYLNGSVSEAVIDYFFYSLTIFSLFFFVIVLLILLATKFMAKHSKEIADKVKVEMAEENNKTQNSAR